MRCCVQAVWRAEPVDDGVQLSLTSPDGDQGYPGEVQLSLTYTLQASWTTAAAFPSQKGRIRILQCAVMTLTFVPSVQGDTLTAEYRAQADRTTPINLTNHSYFNLAGQVRSLLTGGGVGPCKRHGALQQRPCEGSWMDAYLFHCFVQGAADVYDHQVTISAACYLPVDETSIPTGEAGLSPLRLL